MNLLKYFLVVVVLISTEVKAGLVEAQHSDGIYYFLFSSPNKIVRYSATEKRFLPEIELGDTPKAFHISGNKSLIALGRTVYQSDVDFSDLSFVTNTATDAKALLILNGYFYIDRVGSSTLSVYDSTSLDLVGTLSLGSSYYRKGFIGLKKNNSVVFNQYSTVNQITLLNGLKDQEKAFSSISSNANFGNSYIFSNSSQNKIYASSGGEIFNTADGSYIGVTEEDYNDTYFFPDDSFLLLKNDVVYKYKTTNLESSRIKLSQSGEYIMASNSDFFVFRVEENKVHVISKSLNSFDDSSPIPETFKLDSKYKAEQIEFDGSDIVYLLDRETNRIYRWSLSQGAYLSSLVLKDQPDLISFSSYHNRMYVGYLDGRVSNFDLTESEPVELVFSRVPKLLKSIREVGANLLLIYSRGFLLMDKSGKILESKSESDHTTQINRNNFWNQEKNRLYYKLGSTTLEWVEINQQSTFFGATSSGYNSSGVPPIRRIGLNLINGKGKILNADDFSTQNYLANNISEAIQINGRLVTVKADEPVLQQWGSNYEPLNSIRLDSHSDLKLFEYNGKLLVVGQSGELPFFHLIDLGNASDTDSDTVPDIWDNCISDKNPNQKDFDKDGKGDVCDSDMDGDSIPNSVEDGLGLNSLDHLDSLLDLDGDGISNAVEHFRGTEINNPTSIPTPVSKFNENWGSDSPFNMYSSVGSRWGFDFGDEGKVRLIASNLEENTTISSFYISNYFKKGAIGFKYIADTSLFDISVDLDGISRSIGSHYLSEEKVWGSSIEEGEHTIRIDVKQKSYPTSRYTYEQNKNFFELFDFAFGEDLDGDGFLESMDNCPSLSNPYQNDSDKDGQGNECDLTPYGQDQDGDGYGDSIDNCPSIANPGQENIDGDYLGDACDPIDDRPPDADLDGIADDVDNCVNTANKNQSDVDNDKIGDSCDSDADNDGISNEVENRYIFLNPLDKSDAVADFDGDGASNFYEIEEGKSPETADVYSTINLKEYFPLWSKEYLYASSSSYMQFEMRATEEPTEFLIVDLVSNSVSLIKQESDGIYLLESKTGSHSKKIYENNLIIPTEMKLGGVVSYQAKTIFIDSYNKAPEIKNKTLSLIKQGETKWKGKSYPSVTFRNQDNEDLVFLKGLGQFNSSGDMVLEGIYKTDRTSFERISDALDDGEDGFGYLSWKFLFFFIGLVGLIRKANLTKANLAGKE